MQKISIVVERKSYKLHLYSDTLLVKSYRAVFGRNNNVKKLRNDFSTPIGNYKVVSISDSTEFYKYFKLNYPNKLDVGEALKNSEITKPEFDVFVGAIKKGKYGIDNEFIGIQGLGEYDFIFKNLPFVFNWTNGSIAISNDAIDELTKFIKVGTPVIIKN
ncbi:MAG: L,D-transpeptidase [Melioribacteraceae bacterium]|nr:L,D-transpeptidase [Melioribacteraceae bacterium]